ncbi:MAG: hypothetical protein KAS36_14520 [Anaerolineales bacterium]|nr:hypothetical protein [Anaerolineales bacterium]
MGYNDTMDVRGIAWAGYFFDPASSGIVIYTVEMAEIDADGFGGICISAEELKPVITEVEET